MALQRQNLSINFAQGVDTKTDEFQLPPGKFLDLENSVFDTQGRLTKRNGFAPLPTPPLTASFITTYSENAITIDSHVQFFSSESQEWVNKGELQHTQMDSVPIVRTALGQINQDVVIDENGLGCVAYTNSDNLSYYRVFDSVTGQTVINQVALPSTAKMPRVFILAGYFIVTYLQVNSLKFVAISRSSTTLPTTTGTISTSAKSDTTGYDGFSMGNFLYLALNGSDVGGAIRVTYLTQSLVAAAETVVAGFNGDLISVTTQTINNGPIHVVVSFWDDPSNNIYYLVTDSNLIVTLAPTLAETREITALTSSPLTSLNAVSIFFQVTNSYPGGGNRNDLIRYATRTLTGGAIATGAIRSGVGIASKPVYDALTGKTYMVAVYGNSTSIEPTYFLIDDSSTNILAKFAATNASGYAVNQIQPQLNLTSDRRLQVGYLMRTFAVPVNKSVTDTYAGLYTGNGVNYAEFTLSSNQGLNPSEIAGSLILCGGVTTMYDGSTPVELGFHLFPEDVVITTSNGAGTIAAGTYFYYVTYEWTDSQGNVHRSAPSLPYQVVLVAPDDTITLQVPTLRMTTKIASNPVRIVIYRQSTAQPIPYQVTSVTSPVLNTSGQTVSFTDLLPDSSITGNPILYTFGGIVENIGPPPSDDSCLFKSRLFLVDAEDENLLWYSKQVIQDTPVEMSDLFTQFIQPNAGVQGNTGRDTSIFPMDDKLIIFKKDFIYYMTGNGPDNTGANNDFSEPALITSTVGCTNKQSIVFMPKGVMFQSDKGIWLLGRDLSTTYIGADVQLYNDVTVLSAITVPDTNEVRFTLQNGITLVYDYYYQQWSTFNGIPAVSSTVFQEKHTYLDAFNRVFQESAGLYFDQITRPTLLKFKTNWYSLAGIPAYQRLYNIYLMGQALSPFRLKVGISFDYADSPLQEIILTPDNVFSVWGDSSLWGNAGNTWGGNKVFEARIFTEIQKCQSFQLTVEELSDSSQNIQGAGLTLSRINLIVGAKLGYPKLSVGKYVG